MQTMNGVPALVTKPHGRILRVAGMPRVSPEFGQEPSGLWEIAQGCADLGCRIYEAAPKS